MNQELLNNVINEVFNKGVLDDESMAYFPNKYKISREEFYQVFRYLEDYSERKGYEYFCFIDSPFPERAVLFFCKKGFFILRNVVGQGTCSQITSLDTVEYTQNLTMKFLILEEVKDVV